MVCLQSFQSSPSILPKSIIFLPCKLKKNFSFYSFNKYFVISLYPTQLPDIHPSDVHLTDAHQPDTAYQPAYLLTHLLSCLPDFPHLCPISRVSICSLPSFSPDAHPPTQRPPARFTNMTVACQTVHSLSLPPFVHPSICPFVGSSLGSFAKLPTKPPICTHIRLSGPYLCPLNSWSSTSMSVRTSVCPSTRQPANPSVCQPDQQSTQTTTHSSASTSLSVRTSVCTFTRLSANSSVCLPVQQSIHMPACLTTHQLFIHLLPIHTSQPNHLPTVRPSVCPSAPVRLTTYQLFVHLPAHPHQPV